MSAEKARDLSNRAFVSNYPPLDEWLKKHEARCYFQVPVGGDPDDPNGYVEQYIINGNFCIVMVWANKNGWELYTAGDSMEIAPTFADAEKRLGIAP